MDFNRDWVFQKEGGAGQTVHLPHDAMLTEQRDAQCRNGKQSGYFPGDKYTYTKRFLIDENDIGKSIELHFGGVYQNCAVSVNGTLAGTHRYGYTPFSVDISALVRAGKTPWPWRWTIPSSQTAAGIPAAASTARCGCASATHATSPPCRSTRFPTHPRRCASPSKPRGKRTSA